MSISANGHIVVRRQAKNGKDGQDGSRGAKMRWGIYKAGKAYCSGASNEAFYDLVFHSTYQQFFICIKSYPASETHSPTKSTSNGYWEYQPALDNLFVDVLCANEAFLNSLIVRKIFTTDGKTQILEGGFLKAIGAHFQDVKIFGTSRSPFFRYDGAWSWTDEDSAAQLHDNLLMEGGGGWTLAAGGFPWDSSQNGRRITITTHRYNGTLSEGAVSISAQSGKYFFEDGLKKTELKLSSREYVELLGIGEDSTFYGWIVLSRGNIETNGRYGRMQRVLANGVVTFNGTDSSPSISTTVKTFDGSTVYVYCSSTTGRYQITMPNSWNMTKSSYMVMLTAIGWSYGASNSPLKATLVDKNDSYFFVELSDDASRNWGGGFQFQIINLNDW